MRASRAVAAAALMAHANALRHVLVTGANKGVGLQIARKILTDSDASVIIGARTASNGAAALADLSSVPGSAGRVSCIDLDVCCEASVAAARKQIGLEFGSLYGLVNNAGVGFGRSVAETLATNFYGTKRVCDAMIDLIDTPGGRIVNIASASGPMFVSRLGESAVFTQPATWDELDKTLQRYAAAPDYEGAAYGLSKAALSAYTSQLALQRPDLKVNACSPGFILTDLTQGMGATQRPAESKCHVAPLFLLFGEPEGNGRYYGSDAVRSPLDKYRGPGEPPYAPTE
ncbi:hypothetical protein M885DRAFT_623193 [Pelagophyceae sp. CCMP2097]|nr:hypothetical protein M885DRAFT_623193 [Pelagophyceae sp. CCMP2097]